MSTNVPRNLHGRNNRHPQSYCIRYQMISVPRPVVLIDFISEMRDEKPRCSCAPMPRRRKW